MWSPNFFKTSFEMLLSLLSITLPALAQIPEGHYTPTPKAGFYFEDVVVKDWACGTSLLTATMKYPDHEATPLKVVLSWQGGEHYFGNGVIEFVVSGRSCKYPVELSVVQSGDKLFLESKAPATVPVITATNCGEAALIWEAHESPYVRKAEIQEPLPVGPGYEIVGD